MVKILNNGNGKGFPVLRSEANGKGEFNPRAYAVFGPSRVLVLGCFVELKEPVKDKLKRFGLFARLGEKKFLPTID